jgi:hypothetical protein
MKRIGRLIGRAIEEEEEIETSIHHLGLFFHRNNQVASTPIVITILMLCSKEFNCYKE